MSFTPTPNSAVDLVPFGHWTLRAEAAQRRSPPRYASRTMNAQEIIEFLGGATAISLTVGYLGQKAIDGYVSGRIEAYKSELQRIASEHSIRFQKLHSERAEVIKDFYAKLSTLDDTLHSTLRGFQAVGEQPLVEKVGRLAEQFNELREYFLPRRIFFDENLCKLIDETLEIAKGIFFDITTHPVDPSADEYRYNRDVLKERHEFWEKARNAHGHQFAELKIALETEFRELLGIKA